MFTIDKGIPMPRRGCGERERKYPFLEMEPGDSFLIPDGEVDRNQRQTCANSAAAYGKKIAVRRVAGGLRVWVVG